MRLKDTSVGCVIKFLGVKANLFVSKSGEESKKRGQSSFLKIPDASGWDCPSTTCICLPGALHLTVALGEGCVWWGEQVPHPDVMSQKSVQVQSALPLAFVANS